MYGIGMDSANLAFFGGIPYTVCNSQRIDILFHSLFYVFKRYGA
jgi:hypothetical protein